MSQETGVTAVYFDGRSATERPVTLVVGSGRVVVTGLDVQRDEPFDAVEISPAIGQTSRLVRFTDGAHCEVADSTGLARMLAAEGLAPARVSQWENSGRFALASVVLLVLLGIAAYFYGLPLLATVVANRLPDPALELISDQTLRVLDASFLGPTELAPARQASIASAFSAMRWPGERTRPHRLLFRKSDSLGANAFALPSGDVAVTDAFVNLTADDREILAVLAHEVGHVERRHGVRSMIQASTLTLLVTWYVGDVSTLAAAAPTALLNARYSRGFERDADEYAIRALGVNDISPRYFADALRRLEADHAQRGQAGGGALTYLSTHPSTEDRLLRLEQQGGEKD